MESDTMKPDRFAIENLPLLSTSAWKSTWIISHFGQCRKELGEKELTFVFSSPKTNSVMGVLLNSGLLHDN